ncbi:MAG: TonB C-terminal domain-containing protein, partial [bacterium]|nr:TonB C-terminal domain-containing protein [bacterium]
MGKLKLILCICLLLAFYNNANAYTFEEYKANQPSASRELTNQFSDYMENVKSTLQKNWTAPDVIETGHTRMLITLDKEGYVLSAKILESSGNTLYDESAIHALQKSEPFGNFPQDSYRESLTINYSFDTSLVKTDTMREYLNRSNKDYYNGDNQSALKNINLAIQEVQGDDRAFFLYKKTPKNKKAPWKKKSQKEKLAKINGNKNKNET